MSTVVFDLSNAGESATSDITRDGVTYNKTTATATSTDLPFSAMYDDDVLLFFDRANISRSAAAGLIHKFSTTELAILNLLKNMKLVAPAALATEDYHSVGEAEEVFSVYNGAASPKINITGTIGVGTYSVSLNLFGILNSNATTGGAFKTNLDTAYASGLLSSVTTVGNQNAAFFADSATIDSVRFAKLKIAIAADLNASGSRSTIPDDYDLPELNVRVTLKSTSVITAGSVTTDVQTFTGTEANIGSSMYRISQRTLAQTPDTEMTFRIPDGAIVSRAFSVFIEFSEVGNSISVAPNTYAVAADAIKFNARASLIV